MTPILENAALDTDFDARFYRLLNVGQIDPPPTNLATWDDPRLTDARAPLDGSVTNAAVAATAGIVQSKLNLDGQIPTAWLGATATTAAQGDLAEYLSNKGQPNGYASLDATGVDPVSQLPATVGTGTVTSVGLQAPPEFIVTGSPVTGAGIIVMQWSSQSDGSWFGNKEGATAVPRFYNSALPVSLIPSLDASQVTTGVFNSARLPIAVGIGSGNAPGAVPAPGTTGNPSDYLARDMTYKPMPSVGAPFQPTIVSPTLTPSANITGPIDVVVSAAMPGTTLFYSLTSGGGSGFVELGTVPDSGIMRPISVPPLGTVYVYCAKTGYLNSAMVNVTNPNTV